MKIEYNNGSIITYKNNNFIQNGIPHFRFYNIDKIIK